MADTATIIAIVAAICVLITTITAIFQLRNLLIQRKVSMILTWVPSLRPDMGRELNRLGRLIYSCEFKDYPDFVQRYGDLGTTDNEVSWAFVSVAGWYETLGVLYCKKYIDRKIFSEIYAPFTIRDWTYMKPIIYGMRAKESPLNVANLFGNFEYMAEDMRKRVAKGQQSK